MITDSAIDIDASARLVWDVFSDVERWPEWTASVTSLKALDGPGLAVGKRFEIKQPRLPRLVWEVTALDEGSSWTWEQRSLGGRTVAVHEVHPEGERTLVRQRLDQQGPVGSLIGRLMRGTTKRYLELEAQGLKARSRAIAWLDLLTSSGADSCSTPSSTPSPTAASGSLAPRYRRIRRHQSPNVVAPLRVTGWAAADHCRRGRTTADVRVLPDVRTEPADAMAAMWADLRRPELRPFERLFFECYARGAQGEQPFARMLPGAVDSWLGEVDAKTDGSADQAFVRLGLAVTRGLLLDLVATDDDEGVDAAAQAFVALLRSAQTSAASLPASRST